MDIHNMGPWAYFFGILAMFVGLLAGIAGSASTVVVTHWVVLVCILVTLLGRNRSLQWRLADTLLVIIGLTAFSSSVLPHWQPEELPLWGMSLFQILVGLLMIFDLTYFYKP